VGRRVAGLRGHEAPAFRPGPAWGSTHALAPVRRSFTFPTATPRSPGCSWSAHPWRRRRLSRRGHREGARQLRALDAPGAARLRSTVPWSASGTRTTGPRWRWTTCGPAARAHTRASVRAGLLARMIPYLCPSCPNAARGARLCTKVPLVYTNVVLKRLDQLRGPPRGARRTVRVAFSPR
jgi:hypothetical protein